MRLALVILLGLAATARGEPETCKALKAVVHWSELAPVAQRRIPDGAAWEKVPSWKGQDFQVVIDRSPAIARAAIEDCPGAKVLAMTALDSRHLTSMATITITSWGTLTRLAQLPAIRTISTRRHRNIHESIDFGDPF